MSNYSWPNRTLCSILEDIRTMHKTRNFAGLLGAIEEIQWAGNRMEAAIADAKDVMELKKERSKLRAEVNDLKQQVEKLKNGLPKKAKKAKKS